MKTLSEIVTTTLLQAIEQAAALQRMAARAMEAAVAETGPHNGVTGRMQARAQELRQMADRLDQDAREARPKPSVEITERVAGQERLKEIIKERGAA